MFGECPQTGDSFLGASVIRTIVYGGLYWGPLISGNHHLSSSCRSFRVWDLLEGGSTDLVDSKILHRTNIPSPGRRTLLPKPQTSTVGLSSGSPAMTSFSRCFAVKELKLSYHNGHIYIYIYRVNNRACSV